jgi:hypothetical protein
MKDQERIIYYELIKELPFCKIGDQAVILGNNEELSINKIKMPIEYANSNFFRPITLSEHQIIIKKSFITFLMEKLNITKEEAELKSKTFWNLPVKEVKKDCEELGLAHNWCNQHEMPRYCSVCGKED